MEENWPLNSQNLTVNSPLKLLQILSLISYENLVLHQDDFYLISWVFSLLVWWMLYGDYREKLSIKHFWEVKGYWIPWNFDLIKVKLTHRKVNLSSETSPISLYDNCQKINWDYFCLIFVVIDWILETTILIQAQEWSGSCVL